MPCSTNLPVRCLAGCCKFFPSFEIKTIFCDNILRLLVVNVSKHKFKSSCTVYKLKKVYETKSLTELKLERYSGIAPTYMNMRKKLRCKSIYFPSRLRCSSKDQYPTIVTSAESGVRGSFPGNQLKVRGSKIVT